MTPFTDAVGLVHSWFMDYYDKRYTRNSFRSWTSLLFISFFRKILTVDVSNLIIFSPETFVLEISHNKSFTMFLIIVTLSRNIHIRFNNASGRVLMNMNLYLFHHLSIELLSILSTLLGEVNLVNFRMNREYHESLQRFAHFVLWLMIFLLTSSRIRNSIEEWAIELTQ